MIAFESVSKSYGSIHALDDVSFSVEPGEVFGYIGPNGAGKTTSIKIITGLVREYTGTVLVDGRPIEDDRRSFHRRVGYLPQVAGFQEWRTVRHALETFGRLSGIAPSDLPGRIDAVTRRLGLSEHLDRRIVHLSGGMQQRLRFAQAIVHRPEIIILDEPLSGLDPSSRAELKRTIRELASEQRTIILSSHVLADVEDLADRIVILDHGRVQTQGTKEELRSRHRLEPLVELQGSRISEHRSDLEQLGGVERIEVRGNDIVIAHINPDVAIDVAMHSLMRTVVDADLTVRSIRHLEPTLEEVYLSLTEASRE